MAKNFEILRAGLRARKKARLKAERLRRLYFYFVGVVVLAVLAEAILLVGWVATQPEYVNPYAVESYVIPAGLGSACQARHFTGIQAHIDATAKIYHIDPALIRAIIEVESGWDVCATSRVGAIGLMQLMPATAKRMGVLNPRDPKQNIVGGVKYLHLLLHKFNGDVTLAVAAYNAGENAVVRYDGVPPYRETRRYVSKVYVALKN